MYTAEILREAAKEALIKASTTFRPDQLEAYRKAYANETNVQAKWVLEQIISNAEVAAEKKYPLCDDTGIPHVYLELGERAVISGEGLDAVRQGIVDGLRALPARPMAVKGAGLDRLGQVHGMYEDPGMLEHAPVIVSRIPGQKLRLTVLMLGGGPEIRGQTMRVFHRHDGKNVIKEVAAWAAEAAAPLGCTPCVPIIGIGRTQFEASALQLEAALKADFSVQSAIEVEVTETVNSTMVGPLGLGGSVTALRSFVRIGPQRASGVRIVSLRMGCCFDPRRATIELD